MRESLNQDISTPLTQKPVGKHGCICYAFVKLHIKQHKYQFVALIVKFWVETDD